MSTRRVWRLARRPAGTIVADDFRFGSEPIPELSDGQYLLRVRYLSLDPAQRIFIGDREQFLPLRNAVMERMKMFGRVSLCGIISEYNATDGDTQPSFWWAIMMRRLTIRGFVADDYRTRFPEAVESLAAWMQSGHLTTRQDIRQGLENAVSSLQDLYSGRNFGKLLLEVTP